MRFLRADLMRGSRPHPISGTSYGLETAVTAAKCQPGQDLIDKLDQERFYDSELSSPN